MCSPVSGLIVLPLLLICVCACLRQVPGTFPGDVKGEDAQMISTKGVSVKTFRVIETDSKEAFLEVLLRDGSIYEGYDAEYFYLSAADPPGGPPFHCIYRALRAKVPVDELRKAFLRKKEAERVEMRQLPVVLEYRQWKATAKLTNGVPPSPRRGAK